MEEATAKELTELRKSQEALTKALKRKESELAAVQAFNDERMVAQPPTVLSSTEMECIVEQLNLPNLKKNLLQILKKPILKKIDSLSYCWNIH